MHEQWHQRLERVRREAGYTSRKALAVELGVAKGTVDEWEQGHRLPQGSNLKRLEEVLPAMRDALQVSVVGDPRDPNGYVVHLPMDPTARAQMLTELLAATLREQQREPRP